MNKFSLLSGFTLLLALSACGRQTGAALIVALPTTPLVSVAPWSPLPTESPVVAQSAPAPAPSPSPLPSAAPGPQPSLTLQDPIPHFTATSAGGQSDPVNLMVAGTQPQLESLLTKAGWLKADTLNAVTSLKMVKADLSDGNYPTAPVSTQYLDGKAQAVAFEKDNTGIRTRNHLRIWPTGLQDRQGHTFFAIAATKDVGVKWVNHWPTHMIGPNVDAERDLVLSAFTASGQVALQYDLQYLLVNFHGMNGEGDAYYSDGLQRVVELKDAVASPEVTASR